MHGVYRFRENQSGRKCETIQNGRITLDPFKWLFSLFPPVKLIKIYDRYGNASVDVRAPELHRPHNLENAKRKTLLYIHTRPRSTLYKHVNVHKFEQCTYFRFRIVCFVGNRSFIST